MQAKPFERIGTSRACANAATNLAVVSLSLVVAATAPKAAAALADEPLVRLAAGEDQSPGPAPDRTDVPVDDPRYLDDARDLPDAQDVDATAHEMFGDRYAGQWIDRSVTPSALRVNVVGANVVDAALLAARYPGNQRVQIASARFSSDRINAFSEKLSALLAERDTY